MKRDIIEYLSVILMSLLLGFFYYRRFQRQMGRSHGGRLHVFTKP